ncbi:MAG: hypothetical protein OXH04_14285 [Acidobacteria bacterium]|nr:hypothetical protein [Acidobacteriota bacterium]
MMMRQMLVSLVAAGALVGGAPGLAGAQDAGASPVQVETLEIEPTVVKTGDVITQVYRVRFPDLIAQGREIIILEDRMVPENLPIHPFEAVSLEIRKRQVESEHIWDFAYGMRLIAPEKAVYVVPSFGFYYLVRDLGEDIEDAEIQQIDGGQGLVRYVTTMNDLPVLDIRDTIELGEFGGQAVFFRAMAWAVAPLPLLLWLVFLVRLARKPKTVSLEAAREAEELDRIEAQIPVPPSIWEARRTLRAQLRALAGAAQGGGAAVISGLVISARDYLRAELPDVNSGDTPRDIKAHVDGLKDGARKEALSTLASRLVVYQDGLERGEVTIENPAGEVAALDASLTALRPHIRLWRGMLAFVGR